MADGSPLTPERLSELLSRLNAVMTDAERLREITKHLHDQRRNERQNVTVTRRRRAKQR